MGKFVTADPTTYIADVSWIPKEDIITMVELWESIKAEIDKLYDLIVLQQMSLNDIKDLLRDSWWFDHETVHDNTDNLFCTAYKKTFGENPNPEGCLNHKCPGEPLCHNYLPQWRHVRNTIWYILFDENWSNDKSMRAKCRLHCTNNAVCEKLSTINWDEPDEYKIQIDAGRELMLRECFKHLKEMADKLSIYAENGKLEARR